MPKAVLRGGVIVPLEPLPPDWVDGQELIVEPAEEPNDTPEAIDRWARKMEAVCADSTPEDEERMRQAIREHREQAKAQMRQEMGLPQ
jgi:hypothetical protein